MSTTTPMSDLYKKITPYTPGLDGDNPLLLDTLRDVIIEFCRETQAWFCTMDAINVRDGVDTYDLENPSYSRIQTVALVTLDEVIQLPSSDYLLPNKQQIELVHEPSSDTATDAEGLVVQVVLKPTEEAIIVPSCLYEDHNKAWAWGTIARVLTIPKKSWTDVSGAAWFYNEYWRYIAEAKIDQSRGGMNKELQATSPQPFVPRGYRSNPYYF